MANKSKSDYKMLVIGLLILIPWVVVCMRLDAWIVSLYDSWGWL